MNIDKYIQSPLNYTGGKFKLLPQILPFFPKDINVFVDMFCGGANVGVNVTSNSVVFNDINDRLIGLLKHFKFTDRDSLIDEIKQIIKDYDLSDTANYGYDFYTCNSSDGLAEYNKQPYLRLRDVFNQTENKNDIYSILYVLIIYGFNNQIRFNAKGNFNLPVGKRDFNEKMKSKLIVFLDRLQKIDCSFSSNDFRDFDLNMYKNNDFFYFDPPYLITCASYNENNAWNENDEIDLYNFLDLLTESGFRFALSNVLTNKGKTNIILNQWLNDNPRYNCCHLKYNYSNSNYHSKNKTELTDEVLIINY